MDTSAIGAILTGGDSTRMGTDKSQVAVAGTTMADRVATSLEAAGLEVATFGGAHRIGGYPSVPDPPDMRGPLAGLLAALHYAEGRPVFAVAVDQPLLRADTVRHIVAIASHDAVVPIADSYPQVTCALYRGSCLPAIRQVAAVNREASIRDVLAYISVRYVEHDEWAGWGEDGRSWHSVDTPQDVADVEAILTDS